MKSWKVVRREIISQEITTYVMEDTRLIAVVNSVEDIFSKGRISATIAAAPDMLEYLRSQHKPECCLLGIGPFTVCALIAKADGRI